VRVNSCIGTAEVALREVIFSALAASNVAVTDLAAFTARVHVAAVPADAQSPPQPPKVEPAVALAVRVTLVPLAKLAVQIPGQVIPAGVLITVPVPLPETTTVRLGPLGVMLYPWHASASNAAPEPVLLAQTQMV
jgi:hypothetical protein